MLTSKERLDLYVRLMAMSGEQFVRVLNGRDELLEKCPESNPKRGHQRAGIEYADADAFHAVAEAAARARTARWCEQYHDTHNPTGDCP